MEYPRRRGRKGRGHSYATVAIPPIHSCRPQEESTAWNFTNSITSFLVMSSLIGIIYLMLDQHCYACSMRYDNRNLTTTIGQIENNLLAMKDNYNDLHMTVSQFRKVLPKLKEQADILEALANMMPQKQLGWDPKFPSTLPSLEVLLNKMMFDNRRNNSKLGFQPVNTTVPKPLVVNQD